GLEPNSGGGLVAAACTELTATGLTVSSSAFFGILVDNAKVKLGGDGDDNAIIIHTNVLGMWLQGSQARGELTNLDVADNLGVGVGTAGEANAITIPRSQIRGTKSKTMVVNGGGAKEVGDGLLWTGVAKMDIDGLKVGGSARQPILIDGSVGDGSRVANITLE